MTETTVTTDVCKLHREVIDTKIEALKQKDVSLDTRMQGIEDKIQAVFNLQKTILYALIGISVGVALTLFGVILGRGIDLGWLP